MSVSLWFYLDELNQPFGPYTIQEIKTANPNRDPMVWKEGMVDWCPASALNVFKYSDQPPPLKQKDLLLALCKEIIADGVVSKEEVLKLNAWLNGNKAALSNWPGNVLAEHVATILADGEVEDREREQLLEVLKMLTETKPKPGQILQLAVRLPLDEPPPAVTFEGNYFCFIGKFLFGSLKKCQAAVISLGGEVHASPFSETDYVVLGAVGCGTLRLTSKWEKVEKALSLKKSGYCCAIISEDRWGAAVLRQQEQEKGDTSPTPPPLPSGTAKGGGTVPIIRAPPLVQALPRPESQLHRSLCLPVDPDPFAQELRMESSNLEEHYVVNLQAHTCTCPDFLERRALFPTLDIRRACRHICTAIVRRRLLNHCDALTAAVIAASANSGRGAPCEAHMITFEIDGWPMLITFGETEWVNVYARSRGPSEEVEYDRFGYNVSERRWSYGTSPKNSTRVKELIHREVVPRLQRTSKAGGSEKRAGCLSLLVIGVSCFIAYKALKLAFG